MIKTLQRLPQWQLVCQLMRVHYIVCIIHEFYKYRFPPAPSAPPTSVNTSSLTSSSITLQWGPVDCIHHNGDITGYSVQYGVQGIGSTQTMSVSRGDITETTITELTPSTTYSIEVAAVNSAGTGVYSSAVTRLTLGIKLCWLC